MRPVIGTSVHTSPSTSARWSHRGRPAPWFVLAAVAFVAAIVIGCGITSTARDTGDDLLDPTYLTGCDGRGHDSVAACGLHQRHP